MIKFNRKKDTYSTNRSRIFKIRKELYGMGSTNNKKRVADDFYSMGFIKYNFNW